jgi:hypothetical protein
MRRPPFAADVSLVRKSAERLLSGAGLVVHRRGHPQAEGSAILGGDKGRLAGRASKSRKTRERELHVRTVAVLRAHRKAQLERMGAGPRQAAAGCPGVLSAGRHSDRAELGRLHVTQHGRPPLGCVPMAATCLPPRMKLPRVSFHGALRHTCASALIDAGLNVEVAMRV